MVQTWGRPQPWAPEQEVLRKDREYWKLRCESLENSLNDFRSQYNELEDDFNAGEEELAKLKDVSGELENLLKSECETEKAGSHSTDQCPEMPLRESLRNVDPYVNTTLAELRNVWKLSYSSCLGVFVCVANGFFGQHYKLGKSSVKTRRTRNFVPDSLTSNDAAPDLAEEPQKKKAKVDNDWKFTMPSKTFVKDQNKNVHEVLALKSIGEAIKSSDHTTGQIDGMSSCRDKANVMGMMVKHGDRTSFYPVGVDLSAGSDAEATAEHIKRKLRRLAILSSDGCSPEEIAQSLKELCSKLKFWVTDEGPQMKPAVDNIAEWRKELGVLTTQIWTHCNAHIEPALASSLSKVLVEIEEILGVKKYVVEIFNASFFGSNSACTLTMCYALMNLFGPSKQNQEWSMTKKFASFLLSLGEKRNHLQDAKSSRFGKYPEFMALITYHFKSISEFMNTTHEQNKMFMSCQRYINCPYMKEMCFAVALMYYHFLRPFLVACGAEGVEGFKQLTHSDLCSYYPAVIKELKSVSAGDVEKILKSEPLECLQPWKVLYEFSHKGHGAIFDQLFKEISSVDPDLSHIVIKKVVCLLAEGWAGVFSAQTGRFYLEGGTVKELLEADPKFFDGVPTNSLSSEHQVAEARQAIKSAPTSSMSTVGELQIIAKSPYMNMIRNKKYPKPELRKMFKFAKRDALVQEAAKELKLSDEAVQRNAEKLLEESKRRRNKVILDKQKALIKCQENHGGPITSKNRLHQLLRLQRFKKCPKETFKVLRYEIFYQRDVVYNNCGVADKSVFVASKLIDSKMVPKPTEELVKNLVGLLEPDFLSTSIPDVPDETVVSDKLDELRQKLSTTNQVKEMRAQNQGEVFEGDYVATYWQEGDDSNSWYIGRVSRLIQPSACQVCRERGLDKLNESDEVPCYEVVYLTHRGSSTSDYEFKDICEYHTVSCQIICKVNVHPRTVRIFELKSPSPAALDRLMVNNELCKALS